MLPFQRGGGIREGSLAKFDVCALTTLHGGDEEARGEQVEAAYKGPRLEEGQVTEKFVEDMVEHFKSEKVRALLLPFLRRACCTSHTAFLSLGTSKRNLSRTVTYTRNLLLLCH